MSVTDNKARGEMPKSREDMRYRLQQAALELYRERGYDQTTTAAIAARAGVTERTFFRYFPDKREVLFDGEAVLKEALLGAIAEASDKLGPLEILFGAFYSVEELLVNNRPFSEPRQQVINVTPALQERELAKIASLTAALSSALQQRCIEARLATLASQIGMSAFSYAVMCWFDDPATGLGTHLMRTYGGLHELLIAKSEKYDTA